ncbi:MAG: signal peptidase I [Actinomycetota bacterium]|nr:signal peptidase I [Actinomycetota bacterium]
MAEQHFHEQGPGIDATTRARRRGRPSKKGGGVLELLVVLLVAFGLVFGFLRPFVVQSFWIPTESMVPTLEVGDRVFVNKFVYRFAEPERGDIVVFKNVEGGQEELIKRVVGVPGDEVTIRNGVLFVNEERWEEPYINSQSLDSSSFGSMTVPEGKVFVMGDNRANSRDSRFFGPIPIENVEGEAFVVFWPPSHIGLL